ncbi:MAG TPA: hypothetical protein PL033_08475 [Candidatus Brocadiia bacterium]|nr:hypothetical protein [Candidatus Brocadiia bacterium]
MSINAGQLFVETGSFQPACDFVKDYLGEWYQEVFLKLSPEALAKRREEFFLDEELVRSLVVLPPMDGWVCILERCKTRADGEMARSISKKLGCRVIWSELGGASLSQWLLCFNKGETGEWVAEPDGQFGAYYRSIAGMPGQPDRSKMPIYSDVEKDAFDRLKKLGIPASILFLRHDDVFYSPQKDQEHAAFFKIWNRDDGPAYHHYTFPAQHDSCPEEEAPVQFDLSEMKIETSQQLITETRYLFGVPGDETVARVAEIEAAFRERAFQHLIRVCEEDYLPELDVRYVVEGDVKSDFRRLFRASKSEQKSQNRQLYSSHLLSRVGFVKKAMESILRDYPGTKAAETPPLGLRLHGLQDPRSTIVILKEAYGKYLQHPEQMSSIVRESVAKSMRPGTKNGH